MFLQKLEFFSYYIDLTEKYFVENIINKLLEKELVHIYADYFK